MKPRFVGIALFVTLIVALWGAERLLTQTVAVAAAQQKPGAVPTLEVDPMWPKPLPNNWTVGAVIGVAVDSRDHVWIVHRPSTLAAGETMAAGKAPTANCCAPAPPIIEFDAEGNVVQAWGGPGQGYDWPAAEHGLWIDGKDNVWTAGSNGNQILKFTRGGKFLLQIGKPNQSKGNTDTQNLNGPADLDVDMAANEVYVADGYVNRRVIVFDADTGAYKRHWGAYGRKPDDVIPAEFNPSAKPPERFGAKGNGTHCVRLSNDGFLYVCDREQHRIQVFRKDGTFVKEAFWANKAGDGRPAWDIDFSRDPAQTFVFDADGENRKVWILRRDTLEPVGSFGRGGGRWAGQFYGAHSLAVDSSGNVFVGETYEGKRVQKFVNRATK
jgi:DNA-binding beta-propeller fold protein YncE